ncbi:SDR family oxidoreductase [Nonomuraea sp. NPDC050556]|uniref:SDR family oxidoreductase n=1 Tax=Nonomuraea sp. NPDC050556 TaxID=3364369 RepID=UPI0037B88A65
MKIAVAGATGRVGRHVVDILDAKGHDAVPMSRAGGVNVVTGEGLPAALAGVECVIDVSSTPSQDQQEATEFFTAAARNLHEAGVEAGVRRMVVVSIIGAEKFSTGYSAAKAVHERAVLEGPLPVRVLRAAQFHELVEQLVQWGTRGEVSYVPNMRTQIIAARTVAEALVDLAIEPDDAVISEIAGPRVESMVDLATSLVARRGYAVRVEGVSDPAEPLFENGGLLPGPDAVLAGPTFDEWLNTAP